MEFIVYFIIGFLLVGFLTGNYDRSLKQEMRNCKTCQQHTIHLRNVNRSGFVAHIFSLGLTLIREIYRDFVGYYDYRCERCGTANKRFFDFLSD